MLGLLRQLFFLTVSAAVSYVAMLWAPGQHGLENLPEAPLEVAVRPVLEEPPVTAEPEPVTEPEADSADAADEAVEAEEPEAAPPPAELTAAAAAALAAAAAAEEQSPDTPAPEAARVPSAPEPTEEPDDDVAATEDTGQPEALEEAGDPAGEARELMADEKFLEQARLEVSGDVLQGFATDLLVSPREVVDIARFFDEEIVLVPRSAIDPSNDAPHYFRVEIEATEPFVQRVNSRPPLEAFHRYHDLYDHQYADLPDVVRELRIQIPGRSRIYLFAALIPISEMALVVARREQALAASGRPEGDVRRFVLDYVRTTPDAYDIEVIDILFKDGSHFRPVSTPTTYR